MAHRIWLILLAQITSIVYIHWKRFVVTTGYKKIFVDTEKDWVVNK